MRESASSTTEASPRPAFPPALSEPRASETPGQERTTENPPALSCARGGIDQCSAPTYTLEGKNSKLLPWGVCSGGDGRGKCFESQDPARSGEEEPETSLTLNSNCTNRDGAEERARGTSQVTVAQLGWESEYGFYQGLPAEGRIQGLRPWEVVETCTPGSRSLPSPKGTQRISPLPSQTEAEAEARPGRRGQAVSSRN